MRKLIFTISAIATFNFSIAQMKMDNDDMNFVKEAAAGGLMEVKLGELAQTKAVSSDVKTLGQHMITDHTKANNELKALAKSKGITLPTSLDAKGQKHYDELSKKQGKDFDKAYSELMVKDHKEDVEKFQKQAEKGMDAELKSWASKTLPTLQHHLMMSQETAEKMKK